MPARVQVVKTGSTLRVVFHRLNEEPQVLIARDPAHAWQHCIAIISARETMQDGDSLIVRRQVDQG
jgi:hypothetical protein